MSGKGEVKLEYAASTIEEGLLRDIVDTTGGGLAEFIVEYEKLQQALRKSHESGTSSNPRVFEDGPLLYRMFCPEQKHVSSTNAAN